MYCTGSDMMPTDVGSDFCERGGDWSLQTVELLKG